MLKDEIFINKEITLKKSKIEKIKVRLKTVEKTRLNRGLFTPKPITLEIDNIRELLGNLSNDFTNIRRKYSVTDKADWIFRALLYFNPEGQPYIIDTNMNIMKSDVEIGELRNIIIGGEYVKQTKDVEILIVTCVSIFTLKTLRQEMIEKTSVEKKYTRNYCK